MVNLHDIEHSDAVGVERHTCDVELLGKDWHTESDYAESCQVATFEVLRQRSCESAECWSVGYVNIADAVLVSSGWRY